MQPTSLSSLKFLANPIITEKKVIKKINAPAANFERIGKEGRLAISYPVRYDSYQAGATLYFAERVFLDDFCAGGEGQWKAEGDTLTRNQFIFEKMIVDGNFWLTVQTANKHSKAQRIEEIVLDRDHNCRRTYAHIDICTATNTTTGKIHLFVLSSARAGEFIITSFSAAV